MVQRAGRRGPFPSSVPASAAIAIFIKKFRKNLRKILDNDHQSMLKKCIRERPALFEAARASQSLREEAGLPENNPAF